MSTDVGKENETETFLAVSYEPFPCLTIHEKYNLSFMKYSLTSGSVVLRATISAKR